MARYEGYGPASLPEPRGDLYCHARQCRRETLDDIKAARVAVLAVASVGLTFVWPEVPGYTDKGKYPREHVANVEILRFEDDHVGVLVSGHRDRVVYTPLGYPRFLKMLQVAGLADGDPE